LKRQLKPAVAVAALVAVLMIWAAPSHAGWSQPVDISPSVSDGPEATNYAQTAALPDGGFVYVWNKTNQDGSVSVVSRVSYPDGSLSPINLLVAGSHAGSTQLDPHDPTVATSDDGSIRVAWTWTKVFCSPSCDYRYTAETAMLDLDGQISGTIHALDATAPNSFEHIGAVSLSVAPDGNVLLAWRFSQPLSTNFRIRSATAEPGEAVEPSETAFDTSDSSLGTPVAAAANEGGGFIAYPQDAQSLGGVMLAADGTFSDPGTLDPGNPNPVTIFDSSAFIDSDGTGTVVYKRGDTVQEQVFMRKMDADGEPVGSGPVMVSEDDSDRWSNYVTNGADIADDGTVTVAWTQSLTDGGDYAARSRTIAPDGTLGPVNTVAQYPGDPVYFPTVAISPNGGGSILYLRDLGGSSQVLVRALDTGFTPTGTATTIGSSQADSSLDPKGIAYSDNGEATALWGDLLGDQWDLTALRASTFETTPPEFTQTFIQPKAVQGQAIVFAANATDRSGPVTYSWDFGDGGPAGVGSIAQHTFDAPGTYTVKVTATDGADNEASESAQIEVIASSVDPPPDPVPPDTMINGKPAKKTKAKTATFKFISSLAGSTFECRLDKAGWSGCKSPKKLKKLKPGKHTFKVRAIKGDLFDATPASYSWNVKKAKKNKKGGRK